MKPKFIILLAVLITGAFLFFRKPSYAAFPEGLRVGETFAVQWKTNRCAIRLSDFDIGTETATFEIWEGGMTNWQTRILSARASNWLVRAAGTDLMWSGKTAGEIYLYAGPEEQSKIAFPVDPDSAVRFVRGENMGFDWFVSPEDATARARAAIKKTQHSK